MWHSYHVSLVALHGGDLATILARTLAPALVRLAADGDAHRFFHLFYREERLELRLRIQAQPSARQAHLDALAPLAAAFGAAGVRLVPYSRETHYFGETWDSVYAEVMNGHTSTLALSFQARTWPDRSTLALATALTISTLWSEALRGDAREGLSRSVAFARRHAASADAPTPSLAALRTMADALKGPLESRQDVRALAALIRRSIHRGGQGLFVGVHALHLFCNKLGFSFEEERIICETARTAYDQLLADR
ncbi:hypothetical protein B1759_02410 [Rubrivirga sp. SAORIC476]|uniref:thiopeptide-type bacteriocin biosynthesis protein n=1 Tax=Rubrivirga sp. SAORIC476 TaxID=1961794 RepID=UPI000BA8F6A9|nr:thiopeptide-type bacteriocin biosynthesis protein [Rubrivirga sp. SAORIC476]MBC13570.1 hypothetical protein [Rhodothermaceae bacterium]PAP80272.1 hypothetical protein B1759_02410 [Rubrivirga sp. SAORIC476]